MLIEEWIKVWMLYEIYCICFIQFIIHLAYLIKVTYFLGLFTFKYYVQTDI